MSKSRQNVDKLRDIVNVRDFGASPTASAATNTAAIQAAIDFVFAQTGGGTVEIIGNYNINGSLSIGGFVYLQGPGRLTQTANNIPIIRVNKSTFMPRWGIRKLELYYQTQQTTLDTNANALVLCEANQLSYSFIIEDVWIWQAHTGVLAPELTNNFAFLGIFNNVTIEQSSSWGFDWLNATTGGSTYLSMNNVWVNNISGLEIAGSKGFRIRGCATLCLNGVATDHVQDRPFLFESCEGNIGVLSVESCDITKSGTNDASPVLFVNSKVTIAELVLEANNFAISGSAFGAGVRATDGSYVKIGHFRDGRNTLIDTSTDGFFAVNATFDATVYVESYAYAAASSNPVPNGLLADFNTPLNIRQFNQNVRRDVRGGKQHIFATAVPSTGTWAVGDTAWNTEPFDRLQPIGWICVSAGTPGTWFPFGAPTTREATAAAIAAVGNAVNTAGKFAGLLVWDTTNNRMMRARGGIAADPWDVIDGSASVTPS